MGAIHAASFGWTGMTMAAQQRFRDSAFPENRWPKWLGSFACHWGRSIIGALLHCIAPFNAIFRLFPSWVGRLCDNSFR